MNNYLMLLLPGWPRVPPRLWLTAGLGALAAMNLLFIREIWPHTPSANLVFRLFGLFAMLAGCCQLVFLLQAWTKSYAGPWWAQLLFHMMVIPAQAGGVLVAAIALVMLVFVVAEVFDAGGPRTMAS